jgi:hypothetical protein
LGKGRTGCWATAVLQIPTSREADAANESNSDFVMVTVNSKGEQLAG